MPECDNVDEHYLKRELYDLVREDSKIFEFLHKGTLDGLWYWDLERPENEWMSPEFWKLFGQSPADKKHLAAEWQDIIEPADKQVALENFKKHCEDPDYPYDQLVRYLHKDGSTVWVRCRGLAIRDKTGRPVRMLGAHTDVTAIERAKQESERLLQEFIEQSPFAVCILDKEMRYLKASAQWLSDFNLKSDQILGKSHYDLFPEIPTRWKRIHERSLAGSIERIDEDCFERADGTKQWLRWEVRPWRRKDQTIGGLIIYSEDITKRKRAEEALLRQSQEQYTLLVNSISDYAIFGLDQQGNVANWSSGAEKITGYEPDEILGSHFSVFYNFDDTCAGKPAMSLRIAKETGRNEHTGWYVKKSGSQFWASFVISSILDESNQTRGFVAIARDLTQQLKIETELRNSESLLREAQEVSKLGSFAMDVRSGCITWTEQTYRNFGVSPENFVPTAESIAELVVAEDRAKIIARFQLIKAGGEPPPVVNFRVHTNGGGMRVLELQSNMIRLDRNRPTRMVGTVRDITELSALEAQLVAAKEGADAASRAKSAFLANMSHEIRTPLAAVVGYSELLASPESSAADRGTFATAIRRNSELITNIIDDILDISKVEAGKLELDFQEVNLFDLLSDITQSLELKANEKGIKLSVVFEGYAPQTVKTDAMRLKQILINIAGNAVKFTAKGSVEIGVRQTQADLQTKLAFIVRDTGPGITTEKMPLLFQAFSQGDPTTKRMYGGTGLGLALSKRLANLLGGDLVLTESIVNKGSTFTITIDPGKIGTAISDIRATSNERRAGHVHAVQLQGLRVLLTDDSPDNRLIMHRMLTASGAEVDTAENGAEAIEKVHHRLYDVVLMDLQMPILDGLEATIALRAEGCSLPIIALTAHASKQDREDCLSLGFTDHLAKPVRRTDLLRCLEAFACRPKNAMILDWSST